MNTLMSRIAAALGLQVKHTTTSRIAEAQVSTKLPEALAKSSLSEPVRAAIMAVPPSNISQIPARIADARAIEGICAAAARASGQPLLSMLPVAYVMAGTPPKHVRRDLTDYLADVDQSITIDTTIRESSLTTGRDFLGSQDVYDRRRSEAGKAG